MGTNSPRLLVLLIQELKTPKVKGKRTEKEKDFFSFSLTVIKKKVNQIAITPRQRRQKDIVPTRSYEFD